MKKIKVMTIIIFLTPFICRAQQPLKPNEFVVGVTYGNLSMFTDSTNTLKNVPYSCNGILTETNPLYLGNPTSPLNQLSADGFNTIYFFQPAIWSESEKRMQTMIELVKNNGMKIMPFANGWFVPVNGVHDDNGTNCYNNDLSGAPWFQTNASGWNDIWNNCKARTNYEYLFANIYNLPNLKDYIWGHNIGGEHCALHSFNSGTTCCGPSGYFDREVPPARVNEALGWFKSHAQSYQKICLAIVNHGTSYHDGTDDAEWNSIIGNFENSPIDHDQPEYVNFSNKPDVLFDESYTQFPKDNWWIYPYSNIANNGIGNNVHYLSKFKNIEYLKTKCNEVHATSTAERFVTGQDANPDQYLAHYNSTNVLNTNWLWFQGYNSIIHGVKGFWIFGHDMYTYAESQPGGIKAIHLDWTNTQQINRFTDAYFAQHYKYFVRHLGRELAYLQRKNFLSTDANTILYTKTDQADNNCIVPAFSSYMPVNYPSGYGPAPANGTVPMSSDLRSENYSLRYTMRTNGNEVILIVTNPLNIPVTATLNFNNVANPIVRNSTGIKILFENTNPTFSVVSSSTYKTSRNSNIDLTNLNINPTSFQINYTNQNNKVVSLSFGPMDTHVLRFVANPITNFNNGWDNNWSNFGSENIDGWGDLQNDKFYAGDFDGDGTEELFCIQSANTNGWATLLKYQNNDWDWLWSNSGNGWINSLNQGWSIKANDLFYVGDFDGDGRDELLCVQSISDGTYITILKYQNGNWQWMWSNGGNTSIGNGIYPYRLKLTVGDFDLDGKDEVLGVDGNWITLFDYNSNNWQWTWSSSGNTFHMMYPYRNNLRAGDFNGDGRTDILGMNTWATVFYYLNGVWSWGESTSGANNMGGWSYPPLSTDICLAGNVDSYDLKDEIFWLQTGANAAWATTMDAGAGTFTAGWTTNGNNSGTPYIDDWPMADGSGSNVKYLLIKPTTANKKYLLAMRQFGCSNFLVNMYQTNSGGDYRMPAYSENYKNEEVTVTPNPSSGIINLQFNTNSEGKISLCIKNSLGQTIKIINVNSENLKQGSTQIDLSDVPQGIYILNINLNKNSVIKKIVIAK